MFLGVAEGGVDFIDSTWGEGKGDGVADPDIVSELLSSAPSSWPFPDLLDDFVDPNYSE